jgi:ribosome-associated GTPase EngA
VTTPNYKNPVIAIVGRPNVGKSTLFNRIAGKTRDGVTAIVEDTPGVTRDRNYALVKRYALPFILVDTGGFEVAPEDAMSKLVVEQTLVAVEEADIIIALFDGLTGVHPGDEDVVDLLRRGGKTVVWCVNKCDGEEQGYRTAEFYSLGVPELEQTSALHNRGIRNLIEAALAQLPNIAQLEAAFREIRLAEQDAVVQAEQEISSGAELVEQLEEEDPLLDSDESEFDIDDSEQYGGIDFAPVFIPGEEGDVADGGQYLKEHRLLPLSASGGTKLYGGSMEEGNAAVDLDLPEESGIDAEPELEEIRVAIIGRPNVGKSTLLNCLAGEERAITSDVPGTTRDSLDISIERDGQRYVFVDTAGLRKKGKISDKLEKYSTLRAIRSLGDCDVAVLVIDAPTGPVEQDSRIAGLAHEQGKGLIIVINKWDLAEKDAQAARDFKDQIAQAFKFAPYAPQLFISAKTGRRVPNLVDTVKQVALDRSRRVSTGRLNNLLKQCVRQQTPPSYRGVPVRLYYGAQVDASPPRFVLFFSHPKGLNFSYLRFLKNRIREEFSFGATDIKIAIRKRASRRG